MQLAGGGPGHRSMRHAIDHQTTRTADPLTTVMVEGNGHLSPLDEALVDNVEHFQERHVRADVRGIVLHHTPGHIRSGLAPYLECYIQGRFLLLVGSRESGVGKTRSHSGS